MRAALPPFFVAMALVLSACNSSEEKDFKKEAGEKNRDKGTQARTLSQEFKDYWFSGEAEITSYELMQERYGEMRKGTAVTIFVTEDLLHKEQVKTTSPSDDNVLVIKLNKMKRFNTGVYPYSIMSSIFSPIESTGHAVKISSSVQEWCGMVYMQLNNRKDYEIISHSYFEGEADQSVRLKKTWLEDELWSLIRINPLELPKGDLMVLPSFEFIRMNHQPIEAHAAFASIKQGDSLTVYSLNYTDRQRQIIISFRNLFPYEIEKWEEINASNPNDTLRLRTTATLIKRIRLDYWNKNRNEFSSLRDSLHLN